MKQRIRDLEEQLATQTSMLAVLGTPEGKPIDWQSQTPKTSQESIDTQTRLQMPGTQKVFTMAPFITSSSLTRHML